VGRLHELLREIRELATPGTVHFRGFSCELHWKKYPNGCPALYLVDANIGKRKRHGEKPHRPDAWSEGQLPRPT
jgi:hypothetical protein